MLFTLICVVLVLAVLAAVSLPLLSGARELAGRAASTTAPCIATSCARSIATWPAAC